MKNLGLAKKAIVGTALLLAAMALGSLLVPGSFWIGTAVVPIVFLFVVPFLKMAKGSNQPFWNGLMILTAFLLLMVSIELFSVSLLLWWGFNQSIALLALTVMWVNAP